MRYIVTITFNTGIDEREIQSDEVLTNHAAFQLALADMRVSRGPGLNGRVEHWIVDDNPVRTPVITVREPFGYITPSVAAKIMSKGWRKSAIGVRRDITEDSTVPVFFGAPQPQ